MAADGAQDKKSTIIKTAMKLFAYKGFRQTTMQEVAEACQISKGSLYLQFKSKEDLLKSIYETFNRTHMNILMKLEQEYYPSEKERFIRQIESQLTYSMEYREFLIVQHKECSDIMNDEIEAMLKNDRAEFVLWMERRLVQIYGPSFEPYAFDTTFVFCGMIHIFTHFMLIENAELNTSEVSRYLMLQLDYMAEKLLQDKPQALGLKTQIEKHYKLSCSEEASHPLQIVKQMEAALDVMELAHEQMVEAKESLKLIEKELTEIQPRRFVMKGMLLNLRGIPQLECHVNQLFNKLKL